MIRKIVICLVITALLPDRFIRQGAAAVEDLARRPFYVGLDHVPPSLEPLRQELKKLG